MVASSYQYFIEDKLFSVRQRFWLENSTADDMQKFRDASRHVVYKRDVKGLLTDSNL